MAIGQKRPSKPGKTRQKKTDSGMRITQVNNYPLQQTRIESNQPFQLIFEKGGWRIDLEDDV